MGETSTGIRGSESACAEVAIRSRPAVRTEVVWLGWSLACDGVHPDLFAESGLVTVSMGIEQSRALLQHFLSLPIHLNFQPVQGEYAWGDLRHRIWSVEVRSPGLSDTGRNVGGLIRKVRRDAATLLHRSYPGEELVSGGGVRATIARVDALDPTRWQAKLFEPAATASYLA